MEDIILRLSSTASDIVILAVVGAHLAIVVVGILIAVKLFALKKPFKMFMENSKKEILINILPDYKQLKTFYFIISTVNCFYVINLFRALLAPSIVFIHNVIVFLLLLFFAAELAVTIPIVILGNKAEKLYYNLYPKVFITGDLKSVILHSDDKLFETAAERERKEKIKENPQSFYKNQEEYEKDLEIGLKSNSEEEEDVNLNLDFFGGADEELMKYVGGGKRRDLEENIVVPSEETEQKTEKPMLVSCPLCGCLNPKKAKSCDFCGAELDFDNYKDNVDNSEEK